VSIWAWVLMPNHVHLILTPRDADGIRRALSKVHRTYAGRLHERLRRSGHFWPIHSQLGRFGCVPMDEAHLAAALRYIALNPVRARLVKRAVDWRWSSVHDQLSRRRSRTLTDTAPVRERYPDLATLIAAGEDEDLSMALRRAETIGRPQGDTTFVKALERKIGRSLRPAKRGPKPQRAGKLGS
jgi:putative transposase